MNEIQEECRVEDDPGVAGLAQLGRNAIERVRQLERALAERDERISQIERSHAVMQARLRACGQVLVEEIGAAGPENADATAERAARVIRELRSRLNEYEQAPTIGVIRDVGSRPYCDWKVSQATLPKSGAEIIARPARKDGE